MIENEIKQLALRAKERLSKHNSVQMREQIIDTAEETKYISIWLEIFNDDLDMIDRLNKL